VSCAADAVLHVSTFQAAVLGLTQGPVEFIPISSSGHLILVPWAFGWDEVYCAKEGNKFFDVALHLGTFVGAAAYLRRDLWALIAAWFASVRARSVRTAEERLAWFLVLSTIPAALLGALLEDTISEHLGHPWQIAVLLAVFGVLLYAVDRRAPQRTPYREMTARQAIAMGAGQALALAPGVSRSGGTITAGRLMGLDRDAAARFSFLMSLPIILGALIFSTLELEGSSGVGTTQLVVGIACSAVSGLAAVWAVLTMVRKRGYGVFAVYRLAVAALVLALIATNARSGTI
jgi:undecaprenyl-diphosphatase